MRMENNGHARCRPPPVHSPQENTAGRTSRATVGSAYDGFRASLAGAWLLPLIAAPARATGVEEPGVAGNSRPSLGDLIGLELYRQSVIRHPDNTPLERVLGSTTTSRGNLGFRK